jgi:hypothetical protein
MKRTQLRQRILLAVLAVTIVLSAASGKDPEAVQRPETRPARTSITLPQPLGRDKQPRVAVPRIELERLQRRDGGDSEVGNLFGAMSWYVPPPPPPPSPPPKPVPPPPPSAPPMPFSFLGRYIEDETLIILLVKGERIYTVSEGEVIEKTYRVERLQGGVLELTYLPLNIKQTISTG